MGLATETEMNLVERVHRIHGEEYPVDAIIMAVRLGYYEGYSQGYDQGHEDGLDDAEYNSE